MSDLECPPPAYEVSQQEFDRKVEHVVLASASEIQNTADEEWEEWDEAIFQAAVGALSVNDGYPSASASSSTPRTTAPAPVGSGKHRYYDSPPVRTETVQPLHIDKKPRPSLEQNTERLMPSQSPSFMQTNTNAATASSSRWRSVTPEVRQSSPHPTHQLPLDEDDPDDPTIPPPPFTAVGPSLDGPPFEEVDSMPQYRAPVPSNPPSPLASPTPPAATLHRPSLTPPNLEFNPPPISPRQSLPAPRRPAGRMGPRPVTTAYTGASYRPPQPQPQQQPTTPLPLMSFDPAVAYRKQNNISGSGAPQSPPQRPSQPAYTGFYNSAVVAHIPSQAPGGVNRAPSMGASNIQQQRPPLQQQQQYSQQNLQQQVPRIGGYGASTTPAAWPPNGLPQPQQISYDPYTNQSFVASPFSTAQMQLHSNQRSQPYSSSPNPPMNFGNADGRWAASEAHLMQDLYRM